MRVTAPVSFYDHRAAGVSTASSGNRITAVGKVAESAPHLRDLEAVLGRGIVRSEQAPPAPKVVTLLGSPLSLAEPTPSTVRSTAPIGSLAPTPASYSTDSPVWAGLSDSFVTVSGSYRGSAGGTWTATVLGTRDVSGSPPTYSSDDLRLAKSDGTVVEAHLTFGENGAGSIDLPDGLTLHFGGGEFARGDSFSFGVSAEQARFHEGSFSLNGSTVQVGADASVADIVAAINSSGAGVVAVHDATTDRLVLRSSQPGPEATIEFSDDTSGVLGALGLDQPEVTPGLAHDRQRPLADVPAFAGVTAGTITVNGTEVPVDPTVDSLDAVIARISGTDARAEFDPSTHVVAIRPDQPDTTLELSDSSGLLSSLGIVAGTYVPARVLPSRTDPTNRPVGAPVETIDSFGNTFSVLLTESDDYRPLRLAGLLASSRALIDRLSKKGTTAILDRLAHTTPTGAPGVPVASDAEIAAIRRLILDDPVRTAEAPRGRSYARTDGLLEQVRTLVAATAGGDGAPDSGVRVLA